MNRESGHWPRFYCSHSRSFAGVCNRPRSPRQLLLRCSTSYIPVVVRATLSFEPP